MKRETSCESACYSSNKLAKFIFASDLLPGSENKRALLRYPLNFLCKTMIMLVHGFEKLVNQS